MGVSGELLSGTTPIFTPIWNESFSPWGKGAAPARCRSRAFQAAGRKRLPLAWLVGGVLGSSFPKGLNNIRNAGVEVPHFPGPPAAAALSCSLETSRSVLENRHALRPFVRRREPALRHPRLANRLHQPRSASRCHERLGAAEAQGAGRYPPGARRARCRAER